MASRVSLTQLLLTVRYLLPCLAGASIAFTALMFGFFNLEETKGSKDRKVPTVLAPPRSYGTSRAKVLESPLEDRTRTGPGTPSTSSSFSGTHEEESPSAESSIGTNTSVSPSAMELLKHLPLQRVIASSFILTILGTSFDVVFSLLCYTPIHLGGLSRTVCSLSCPVCYILTSSIAP